MPRGRGVVTRIETAHLTFARHPACLLLLLLALVTAIPGVARAQPAAPRPADNQDSVLADLQNAAADGEKSTLAAQLVLQTIIMAKEDAGDPRARSYLAFIDRILDLENLARNEKDVPIAEKLIASMGYLASNGQIVPGASERLLPLVGVGSDRFRRVLRDAILNLVRAERKGASGSPTLDVLGKRLVTNSPPSREVLREISAILQEIDPKALVDLLVQGIRKNSAGGDGGGSDIRVYVLELRRLLLVDFPSPDAWATWWEANRSNSYQEILRASHDRFHARRVSLWQNTLQRVRETNDPERYLGLVTDTFETDFTQAMRDAVLGAVGAFPAWLRDNRFPTEGPVVVDEAAKARFLARAATFLLDVISGVAADGARHVSIEVKSAALAALRGFNGTVGKPGPLRERATMVLLAEFGPAVLDRLESAGADAWGPQNRVHGLELIRTVGALRLDEPGLRDALKVVVQREPDAWPHDQELLAEAVTALGRVQETSPDPEIVDLIVALYQGCRQTVKKTVRDLRKACVTALNVPIQSTATRDRVRDLYAAILKRADDKPLRIPAIVGLGILAKAGDASSVEVLKDVLVRRTQFDSSEVGAVIDALAYLGGSKALLCFIDFLGAKDEPFGGQVWGKVLSILKGDKLELFAWLLARLGEEAFSEDPRVGAAAIVRLAEEPELRDLVTGAKVDLEDRSAFMRFWNSAMVHIDSLDVLGRDEDAQKQVALLADLVVKNEKVKQHRATIVEELAALRARSEAKTSFRKLLGGAQPDAAAVAAKAADVVGRFGADAAARWRGFVWVLGELQQLQAGPIAESLANEIHAHFESPSQATLWRDIPEPLRAHYQAEATAIRARLKTNANEAN